MSSQLTHVFISTYLQVSYSTLKFHVSFPLFPFNHNYYLKEAKVYKDGFSLSLWPGLARKISYKCSSGGFAKRLSQQEINTCYDEIKSL